MDRASGEIAAHVERYNNEVTVLEEYIDGVHFGLVEFGGFVRHSELTGDQRRSMLLQERSILVIFDMKQRAPDTTDPVPSSAPMEYNGEPNARAGPSARPSSSTMMEPLNNGDQMDVEPETLRQEEDKEEESPTSDPKDEGEQQPPSDLRKLVDTLRSMQNEALSAERFSDASELQIPIMVCLESTTSDAGLSMEVVTAARNSMQRLFRASRNRGEIWLSEIYKAYAEDFQLLLQ